MNSAVPPVMLTMPQNGTQSEKERISKLFSNDIIKMLSIIQLVCAGLAAVLEVSMKKVVEFHGVSGEIQ